jgi:toxin ParE1/3/4
VVLSSIDTVGRFKAGRAQTVGGVRKLVTRKYRYLVYYSVDERQQEVAILAIRHPAREREFEDA